MYRSYLEPRNYFIVDACGQYVFLACFYIKSCCNLAFTVFVLRQGTIGHILGDLAPSLSAKTSLPSIYLRHASSFLEEEQGAAQYQNFFIHRHHVVSRCPQSRLGVTCLVLSPHSAENELFGA